MWKRAGFTVIELVIAITLIGIVSMVTIPRVKEGMLRESVRNSRRSVTTHLARARGAAATRGCRSVLHLELGVRDRVWVTACSLNGVGTDTIGAVDNLTDRFGVDVVASGDSIVFNPNGVAYASGWIVMEFAKSGTSEQLTVSPLGRPLW